MAVATADGMADHLAEKKEQMSAAYSVALTAERKAGWKAVTMVGRMVA